MQVMLLIHTPETAASEAERAEELAAYEAYTQALIAAGVLRGGDELGPSSQTSVVRVRHGELTVQDGPFADTKEQLGGYYLLEVADADEARRWAARCPGAATGAIEIRPVVSLPFPDPS